MKKSLKRVISIILCVTMIFSMNLVNVIAADEVAGNLLTNPDFEDDMNGWNFSGDCGIATNHPYFGNKHFYTSSANATIEQTVTISQSGEYRLSAALSGTGEMRIRYTDGDDIASLEHPGAAGDGEGYTYMSTDAFSLEAGDSVTIYFVDMDGRYSWLNGDSFCLASADYDTDKEFEDKNVAEANILVNPNFEIGSGTVGQTSSIIEGWAAVGGGWMNNNEYSGSYGFYLNSGSSNNITQTVEIPKSGEYILTGYIAGWGTFGIRYENGAIIKEVSRSNSSYAKLTLDGLMLEEGDRVTVYCVAGNGWLNGDEFCLAHVDDLSQELADAVIALIDALGDITLDKRTDVEAARSAYDELPEAAKVLVSNYQALVEAEKKLNQLEADTVMALIDALGDVTEESLTEVVAARNAYDALTDMQKELVLNLPVLEAAEDALKELGIYVEQRMTPIMGWSSWNKYNVNITEELFVEQMNALVDTGLAEAGYTYFNIDDGYQGGRDDETGLVVSNERFPSGMRYIADYAHALGLKAGIYTDAGENTCASVSHGQGASGTGYGLGVGLYGHDYEDLYQYFIDWDYDFIKVDWCGGRDFKPQALNQQTRYTEIGKVVDEIELLKGEDIIYNICCWQFPGAWAVDVADSWRVSGDISPNFNSVLTQLDSAATLAEYHGPGHVNDMDMMQVGNGMTYEEDKSHFSMWCMLSVPLILGNDLTEMSDETLEIITNEELIAINQDPACIMATVATEADGVQVWQKALGSEDSHVKAVALLNRNNYPATATVRWDEVGLSGDVTVYDLWAHKEITVGDSYSVVLPAHGVAVLKVTGDASGSDSILKSEVTSMPAEIDLSAEGTLDWYNFATGESKENAYVITPETTENVIDSENAFVVNVSAVSTERLAKVYVSGDAAVRVTAVLDGKQTSEIISGSGVYEVAYTSELNGTNLVLTVSVVGDGTATVDAVAVSSVNEAVVVTEEDILVISDAPASAEVDLEAEGTLDYISFGANGDVAAKKAGILKDYMTAEGANVTSVDGEVTYIAGSDSFAGGAAQHGVYDYFEITLPATADLTKANIYYGISDARAILRVEKGDEVQSISAYDLQHGENNVLTIWYTSEEEVCVTLTVQSVFAEDSYLSLEAVTLSEYGKNIMTYPEVAALDNVLTITADTVLVNGNNAADSFVAELYDAEGNLLESAAVDVTIGGEIQNIVTLPDGFTEGTLTVSLVNAGASYTYKLPLEEEYVPAETELIGNLLAKELVANGAILVDVRSAEEYEAGHIEGAINILYTQMLGKAEELLPDKSAQIIVYCSAGKRSTQAQMALAGMGYENVYNIGSMNNWYIEPSVAISGSNTGITAGTEIAITYQANPYEKDLELYYSMGEASTFADAVKVPDGNLVPISGDGWVKGYLTWKGEVIAEEATKLPLLVNLEIPDVGVSVYMSDMEWLTNTSYWRAANKDKSIDGASLGIAGIAFEKGIGAHAWSIIEAEIPEGVNRFVAVAGCDDEMEGKGNLMQFAVYIDDVLMGESLEMPTGYYHIFDIKIPANAEIIRLEIYQCSDGYNYDHGDWGIAGFAAPTEEDYHAISVTDGTASAEKALWGTEITLTANAAPEGKEFDKWVVEAGEVVLDDAASEVTAFTMPDGDVSVKAVYKDEVKVPVKLEILTQPQDAEAVKGGDAVVTVEAAGDGLTYTWYYKNPGNRKFYVSGDQFVSEDGAAYSIPMYAWRDGQEVYCVITDMYGDSVQTDTVTLSMSNGTVTIVKQPESVAVAKGEDAVVTVEATGEGLVYTWYYKNPGNVKFYVSGDQFVSEDGATYTIPMYAWRDGQEVYCVITDANGAVVQTNTVVLSMQ